MPKFFQRSIPTLLLILSLIILVLTVWWPLNEPAKNAPNDPMVNEAINQARSLQKQGKLEDAIVVFERYALQGYPDAMFHTAKAYSRGWGIKPDLDKARHYYLLAVQYSYAYRGETAYEIGRLFQRSLGPDCNKIAIEWFKKSLNWNYKKAALQLAIHYEKGLGVEQNVDLAIDYYTIASQSGYEQASLKYARLMMKGRYGVEINSALASRLVQEAIKSLKIKARKGSPSAAKQLGRLYRDGELIRKSSSKARKWLYYSAELGDTGGMHDLAHFLLSYDQVTENEKEALNWFYKAARKGHGGAMTALGRLHLNEKYHLKMSQAVHWFERGVEAKHGGAMEELARLYATGHLVDQNQREAIRLAKQGSKLGHLGSQRLFEELTKLNITTTLASVNS